MAWEPSPKVRAAQSVAQQWQIPQVIIVGLDTVSGRFEVVSYGETVPLCEETKRVAELVHKAVRDAYE